MSTQTVRMRAPDGSVRDVPTDQVDHYVSLGATVEPSPLRPQSDPTEARPRAWITVRDPQAAALDLLPMIGAVGGGLPGTLLGPVGFIGGSGVGAGGGELLRQVLAQSMGRSDLVPEGGAGGAMSVLREALLGAGTAGIGVGARALSRGAGRGLMADALRPSATMTKPAIVAGGPRPVDVMERTRIPVGKVPGSRASGFERADAATKASVGAAEAELAKIPGKPFTVQDVVNEASNELAEIRKRAVSAKQVDSVNEFVSEAAAFGGVPNAKGGGFKPQRLTAVDLNERKRTWQKMAKGQFSAEGRTGSKQQAAATLSSFEQETAKALAAAANRLLRKASPNIARMNQTSREMGMLREALLAAEARPVTLNPLAHSGAANNAAFALARPEVTSRLGLGLTHPVLLRALQYTSPGLMALEHPSQFR